MLDTSGDAPVLDLDETKDGADWIRAGRLRDKAQDGDKDAARELARMEQARGKEV